MPKLEYFPWLAEVCKELGISKAEGAKFVEDLNWFGCWDDGLTPAEAVKEAKSHGIV